MASDIDDESAFSNGCSSLDSSRALLQRTVQSVQWTYSIFWRLSRSKRMLLWSDGFYNGDIKTRKTVNNDGEHEVLGERSQQLRDLFLTLGKEKEAQQYQHNKKRPAAALSPEDLTDTEWFYLVSMTFEFQASDLEGLPGQAIHRGEPVWLCGASEVESKIFSRALLSRSAGIQTVLCIPMTFGVLELGSTQLVPEDQLLVRTIREVFTKNETAVQVASTGESEESAGSGISMLGFQGDQLEAEAQAEEDHGNENGSADFTEEDISTVGSSGGENSEAKQTCLLRSQTENGNENENEMVYDGMCQEEEEEEEENMVALMEEFESDSMVSLLSVTGSAFCRWSESKDSGPKSGEMGSSQDLLKRVLSCGLSGSRRVKINDENSRRNDDGAAATEVDFGIAGAGTGAGAGAGTGGGGNSNGASNDGHVLAERKRRIKLNEKIRALRSMVPLVTKMDKASVLGDTINYLQTLQQRVQELETQIKQKKDQRLTETTEAAPTKILKRKIGSIDEEGTATSWHDELPCGTRSIQVSIIEEEALIEISCGFKEGLPMKLMEQLCNLGVEPYDLHCRRVPDDWFVGTIRAKVRKQTSGQRATISRVKNAIAGVIPA